MRVLPPIQAVFAAAFLLVGLVALLGLGLTGVILLVLGGALAAVAAVSGTRTRAGTIVALAADASLGYFATIKLLVYAGLVSPSDVAEAASITTRSPGVLDIAVPGITLALVTLAYVAVALDWRAVRAAPWFGPPEQS